MSELSPAPAVELGIPVEDPLLANQVMAHRGVFYPLGFCVEIYTNDRAVLDAAEESWGHFRPRQMTATIQLRIGVQESASEECPPAPTHRAQGHLITFIADVANHATVDLKTGFGFAFVSRAAVRHIAYFRYHFLEALALVLVHGMHAPAIHSACLIRNGRGMLFCGASGAGKSTLAYACALAGFTYITDDASYLLADSDYPRVVGHSHKFRLRTAARELFPELQSYPTTPRLEGKPSIEVLTSKIRGLITAQEARIHYLILLRRSSSGAARLVPISTDLAIQSLHEHLYPVDEIRRSQIAALQKLSVVEAFEFYYSDLERAIPCLEGLTSTSGVPA